MNTRQIFFILLSLLGAAIVAVGIWGAFLLDDVPAPDAGGAALAVMATVMMGAGLLAGSIPKIYK